MGGSAFWIWEPAGIIVSKRCRLPEILKAAVETANAAGKPSAFAPEAPERNMGVRRRWQWARDSFRDPWESPLQ
jgi:hypothetical protein